MKHMVPAGNISKVAVEEAVHALSWLLAGVESVYSASNSGWPEEHTGQTKDM